MSNPSIILEVQNLSYSQRNTKILQDVNFKIYKGDFAFLLGENGAGKSTLVKMILNLLKPQSGKIAFPMVDDENIDKPSFIGYVPQYSSIERDFPISVKEVIELQCCSDRECGISVSEHLKFFRLENLADKRIGELSGGEFQKVLIVRALSTNPSLLILDEPFNNLDSKSRRDLCALLRKFNKKSSTTVLLVTHGNEFIENTKDKILLLEDGAIKEMHAKEYVVSHTHLK